MILYCPPVISHVRDVLSCSDPGPMFVIVTLFAEELFAKIAEDYVNDPNSKTLAGE